MRSPLSGRPPAAVRLQVRLRPAAVRKVTALFVGLTMLAGALSLAGPVSAEAATKVPSGTVSLFSGQQPSAKKIQRNTRGVELGTVFKAARDGQVTGLRIFRIGSDTGTHKGHVWSSTGKSLGSLTFPRSKSKGWQYASFAKPVTLTARKSYIASFHTSSSFAVQRDYFPKHAVRTPALSSASPYSRFTYKGSPTAPRKVTKGSNYWVDPVFRVKKPAPKPAPKFPGASNTGVTAGVKLSTYTGPMTITTPGTVIDRKSLRGTLVIAAPRVTVKRSLLYGNIDSDRKDASVSIIDTDIRAGRSSSAAVGYHNVTIVRSDISGGKDAVNCGTRCRVEASWLHGQYLADGEPWHNNGFISNGGTGVALIGNTIQCSPKDNKVGGGCTGNIALFGDFSAIKNVVVEGNLFKATPGGFCGTFGYNEGKPFGRDAQDIRVANNVFERGSGGKCGYWGPAAGLPTSGSWVNNRWTDGVLIRASAG